MQGSLEGCTVYQSIGPRGTELARNSAAEHDSTLRDREAVRMRRQLKYVRLFMLYMHFTYLFLNSLLFFDQLGQRWSMVTLAQ